MKKIISYILVFSIFFCIPINIFADEATDLSGTCGPDLTYSFSQMTGTLTISGTGEMYNYSETVHKVGMDEDCPPWVGLAESITDVIICEGVTSVGSYAFYPCNNLKEIFISDSIISINLNAVKYCDNIESIHIDSNNQHFSSLDGILFNKDKTTIMLYPQDREASTYSIPDGITSIGEGAFYNCQRLGDIAIPNSVTSIGEYAFYGCRYLDGIIIPYSVTSIGDYAFGTCWGLGNITIPNSVTSIGANAFLSCYSFTEITIPNSITSIGPGAFACCEKLRNIFIPDSVTFIGRGAFNYCRSLEKINIPESVTIIDGSTFSGCENLTSVTIPDSITSIGDYAFYSCYGLKFIEIPNGVVSIGENAFSMCGLKNVTLPQSVVSIGKHAFYGVKGIVLLDGSVITIEDEVLSIPENTTIIDAMTLDALETVKYVNVDGDNPYYVSVNGVLFNKDKTALVFYPRAMNVESYAIPNGIISIENWAFRECWELENITIPSSVTSFGEGAFSYCNFHSIIIPNSVTYVGKSAFDQCRNLEKLTIPDSVKYIGDYAFYGCDDLTTITIPNSVTFVGEGAFSDIKDGAKDLYNSDYNLRSIFYLGNDPDIIDSLNGNRGFECNIYHGTHYTDNIISVIVDGQILEFDQPPIVINDRVMVPMRRIFEVLGYKVEWDNDTQMVSACSDDLGYYILSSNSLNGIYDMSIKATGVVKLQIGNPEIVYSAGYDSGIYLCDVPPQLVLSRTMVPLRAIAECASCIVDWNDETKTVIISTI